MRTLIFIFCLSGANYATRAQAWDWAKNIDMNAQEEGYSIGSDKQGNFYISGTHHYSTGGGGCYYYGMVWKLDKNGNVVWRDTLVGDTHVAVDTNGIAYTAGTEVRAYSPSGQKLWQRNLGYQGRYMNVKIHPSGNIIAIGNVIAYDSSSGQYKSQGILSSYNHNGNCIFSKIGIFPPGPSLSFPLTFDKLGNYYIASYNYYDSATGNSSLLTKCDMNGNIIFNQIIPDNPSGIAVDAHSNIYVAGWYSAQPININGTIYSANNTPNQYLIKYDSHGNLLWYKILSGYLQTGSSIALGADDNIYYTSSYYHLNMTIDSYTLTGHTSVEAFVFMADSLGNIKWLTTTSGSSNSLGSITARDVLVNKMGDVFITGLITQTHNFGSTTIDGGDYGDMLIAKLSQQDAALISPSETKKPVFTIYPNPSSGIFTINYSSQEKSGLEIKITNVKGQTIFTESISHFTGEYTKDIDLSKYARGIYFVEILADRKRTIRKIVLD